MDNPLTIEIFNSVGVIFAILGVLYGIFRNANKDKNKYATKMELKEAIKDVEEKTDLKIEVLHQSFEENKVLFEYIKGGIDHINKRIDKLYAK